MLWILSIRTNHWIPSKFSKLSSNFFSQRRRSTRFYRFFLKVIDSTLDSLSTSSPDIKKLSCFETQETLMHTQEDLKRTFSNKVNSLNHKFIVSKQWISLAPLRFIEGTIKSWLREHRRIDHVVRQDRYFPRSFTKPREISAIFCFFRVRESVKGKREKVSQWEYIWGDAGWH